MNVDFYLGNIGSKFLVQVVEHFCVCGTFGFLCNMYGVFENVCVYAVVYIMDTIIVVMLR